MKYKPNYKTIEDRFTIVESEILLDLKEMSEQVSQMMKGTNDNYVKMAFHPYRNYVLNASRLTDKDYTLNCTYMGLKKRFELFHYGKTLDDSYRWMNKDGD